MSASQLASEKARPTVPEAVVAGHVSLDVVPALRGALRLEPGRLVVVGPAVISTGGAVANVGVTMHRLGVGVGLSARVGADLFGRAVLDSLTALDPRLADGIVVSTHEVTSYTIVINPSGVDRSFLHCPGANEGFSTDDVRYESLAGARVFHFGYPPLMPLMYRNGGAQLREMFARVQRAGGATSLDLCEPDPGSEAGQVDWEEVLTRALPFVDVFAPSIDELLFMLDRPAHERLLDGGSLPSLVDHSRLAELGQHLTGMGVAVVALKLGDQGLYLRTTRDSVRMDEFCRRMGLEAQAWHDRELLSPCFKPQTIGGTTGAGDATVAGLLAALLRGAGPSDAATIATAVGAFSVEGPDPASAVPALEHVSQRLADGWSRLPVLLELPADLICN